MCTRKRLLWLEIAYSSIGESDLESKASTTPTALNLSDWLLHKSLSPGSVRFT
jgi:hypothetical protein